MPSPIDPSTALGARARERLGSERIIWLTTVTPRNRPLPRPVWFLWLPETPTEVVVYSQDTPRIHNLATNSRVTLNFKSNEGGGDIVVFTGEARIDPEYPRADGVSVYLDKYAADMKRLDYTPDAFADAFRLPIRIGLASLYGH